MTLQRWTWACSVFALFAWLAPSAGAQQQLPDRATLAAMGLADLEVMADDEAMTIRGQGFSGSVSANGLSWASVASKGGSAGSVNSFHAWGERLAYGENYSFARASFKKSGHSRKHGGHKRGGMSGGEYAKHGGKPSGHNRGGDYGGGKHGGGHQGGHDKSVSVHAGGYARASL